MTHGRVPFLGPGETAGPFVIRIPREAIFYAEFLRVTSRIDRLLWRLGIRRGTVALRLLHLLEDEPEP